MVDMLLSFVHSVLASVVACIFPCILWEPAGSMVEAYFFIGFYLLKSISWFTQMAKSWQIHAGIVSSKEYCFVPRLS